MFGFAAFGQVAFGQGPPATRRDVSVLDLIATMGIDLELFATLGVDVDTVATFGGDMELIATFGPTD